MNLHVIITGSTGMVGRGVLYECLNSEGVGSVLVLNRHPVDIEHPKLTEIIHKDFFNLDLVKNRLSGYDCCFFCLGVSSAGLSELEYNSLTYDLTLYFAKTLFQINPDMSFLYVSGAGTDSSEKGRIMWSRIKGKTENALLNLGFKAAFMFRPGYIQPLKNIRSKTPLYNGLYAVFKIFYPVLKKFPSIVTSTTILGQAMIHVAVHGYEKPVLESTDINYAGKFQE